MSETKQVIPLFISGTGDDKYREFDGEWLHNATLIKGSAASKSQSALVQRDGLVKVVDFGGTAKCGFYSRSLKKQFIRVGNEIRVYDLAINNSYVTLTGIPLDNNTVRLYFTDTFMGVVISDGILGYSVDLSLNVTSITGNNFQPISSMDFVDGYTLISIKNSRFFNHSELNDTLFDNGLFTYGIAGAVGNIRNLAVINREVYVFCDSHTEIWYNAGSDVNAPFTKQDGRVIHAGVRSVNTVVVNGVGYNAAQSDTLISIYSWSSGNIQKIGCGALENRLDEAKSIRMLSWYENNIAFIGVLLNEFTAKPTLWAYNIDTASWSTRDYGTRKVVDFIKFSDKYYLITDSSVYLVSGSTDDGDVISSYKRTGHISNNNFRLFHRMLEIDVGGDVASFVLDISDDGGNSWKNTMYSTSAQVGQYNRYRFNRLGASRDRVYQLNWSSSSNAGIYNVLSDIEMGTR